MKESDRAQFAEALNQLFSIYGEEVTNRMRDSWWGLLKPYHLQAVMAAMNLHAGNIKGNAPGKYRPTPADIKLHLEVTIPAMARERADRMARETRARIAPLREAIARAEADYRLGMITREKANSIAITKQREIRQIMAEPEVVLALNFDPKVYDTQNVGPEDRNPDAVRLALSLTPKSFH